jgi:site-specific DNA recombinase
VPVLTRAAIYARVSTDEQAEKYGLSSQLTELRALAARKHYHVVATFADDGVSGATLDRPQLTALRDLVARKGADVVLVHASDRLSRDLIGHLLLTDEIRRAGLRLEYVSHVADDSPEGQFREQVLGALAQLERAKIKERTSRGRREQARSGIVPGGPIPFGYRKDPAGPGGLALDAAEAAIVRRMYAWLLDGASIRDIAKRLTTQGVTPRRGTRWGSSSVRRILTGTTYVGEAIYNRRTYPHAAQGSHTAVERDRAQWITIPTPAIIARATWDRAQAMLTRNIRTQGGRPSTTLLRGLLVCGLCGRHWHAQSSHGIRTYRCYGRDGAAHGEPCTAVAIRADRLDAAVWADLVAALRDPATLVAAASGTAAFRTQQADTMRDLAGLQQRLAAVETKRRRLLDLHVGGSLAPDLYAEKAPALDREAAALAAEIATLGDDATRYAGAAADRAALIAHCKLLATGLDRIADDPTRRADLVHRALDKIVIGPEGLRLHWVLDRGDAPGATPEPATRRRAARTGANWAVSRAARLYGRGRLPDRDGRGRPRRRRHRGGESGRCRRPGDAGNRRPSTVRGPRKPGETGPRGQRRRPRAPADLGRELRRSGAPLSRGRLIAATSRRARKRTRSGTPTTPNASPKRVRR